MNNNDTGTDNQELPKAETVQDKKIKFNFDLAQKTSQQSLELEDSEASGHEIYEESPSQHKFIRFRGANWNEPLKVHGVKLQDPDGDDVKYIVQTNDPKTFNKINMMCDWKVKEYVIAPYVSDTGAERIWFANYKWSGKSAKKGNSVRQCIEQGQQNWIRINWEAKRGFVARQPGVGLSKEPQFSKIDNEGLIELCFEERIITDANHEAVKENWS